MQVVPKELSSCNPTRILTRSTPVGGELPEANAYNPDRVSRWSPTPSANVLVRKPGAPGGQRDRGSTDVEFSPTGKWLELLKEIAPGIKRVAFIIDPKSAPGGGSYYTRLIEASAATSAVAPTVAPVHDAVEIERAIGEFVREQNDGLVVLPDATTLGHRELVVALAARHRAPAIYAFRDIVVDAA